MGGQVVIIGSGINGLVAGAELAVVTGVGGMFSAHATAILGAAR